jgi:hypothetical protein
MLFTQAAISRCQTVAVRSRINNSLGVCKPLGLVDGTGAPGRPGDLAVAGCRHYGPGVGREKTITVAEPGGTLQKYVALPEVAATYCLPATW